MRRETHLRSILKALIYRLFGSFTTMVIAFVFTGQIGVSAAIGGLELVSKIGLYYFYERVWERIKFGIKDDSKIDYEI